jgi:endonuclease YncB( thermonuclease family)
MPKQLAKSDGYPVLLSQLKKVFIEGLQKIEEEKVKTYWRTGELISRYILENKERAEYGKNLFERLSEDLAIERSTLQRTVQFYRTYPILGARHKLSWIHYRKLITIEDRAKRELFEERAVKKEWTSSELFEAIRLDRLKIEEPVEAPSAAVTKLSVTRARLYTYQVLEPSYIHPIEEWLTIDLGFNTLIHTEIKGLKLKAGELVESEKLDNSYKFKHSDAKPKELYTYIALVERVIDADTIWLNIDLGFSCWSRQKVRLRDIDAPELSTKKGLEAKEFVEAKLKKVPFVVVKTYKSDKYDRYLTDVFYLNDEAKAQTVLEEGTFLNQELLDLGLAVVMEE